MEGASGRMNSTFMSHTGAQRAPERESGDAQQEQEGGQRQAGAYQVFQSAPRMILLQLSVKKTVAIVATRPNRSRTKISTA